MATTGAGAATAGSADATVAAAARALRADPVYVAPGAQPTLTRAQADELRASIEDAGGDVYIAILPADVLFTIASPEELLAQLRQRVGREGTYVVFAGIQLEATSTAGDLGAERARELANEAYAGGRGLPATLAAIVEDVAAERGRAGGSAGGGDGPGRALLVAAAVVGALLLVGTLVRARRRSSAVRAADS